VKFIAMY